MIDVIIIKKSLGTDIVTVTASCEEGGLELCRYKPKNASTHQKLDIRHGADSLRALRRNLFSQNLDFETWLP
jgi:hypothetical protein